MRSVAPITKIVPLFLWSAKMPKIYAKCQKFMQKLWNFIFCHLNIVRAVYKLSFKLLVRSVAQITKIVPLFLWSAKMPKIYAKCQKSMQKTWNFIFCHLNLVRAVYYLSFKLLVRSVAPLTKILPPFLWFGGVYVTNIEGFAMVRAKIDIYCLK